MEAENKRLQKIRKKEIENVISKYKTLYDKLLEQVTGDFPTFKDIIKTDEKENNEVTITAEEQLYNFTLMREKAVDHADRILNKINILEIELYAPEMLKSEEDKISEAEAPKKNWTKTKASESKSTK